MANRGNFCGSNGLMANRAFLMLGTGGIAGSFAVNEPFAFGVTGSRDGLGIEKCVTIVATLFFYAVG